MNWKEISLTTSQEASEAGANILKSVPRGVAEDSSVLDRYLRKIMGLL